MDPINSDVSTVPQMYAMKKAMEVQERGIQKILDGAQENNAVSSQNSGSSLTGIGQTLDIKA